MSSTDSPLSARPLDRVRRLSRIGIWASTVTMLLAGGFLLYIGFWMIAGDAFYEPALIKDLAIDAYVDDLSVPQAIVGTILWRASDVVALLMLWNVRRLFQGSLSSGVFSVTSTTRLRRIGVLLLIMGPV